MARVYKRGAVWWAQWRGERFSLGCSDRKAAELEFAKRQRRAADPTLAHEGATDLSTAATEWLASTAAQAKPPSPETCAMYELHTRHFVRLIGNVRLEYITAKAVDDYAAARRRETWGKHNVSAHTVAKELGTLRQILTFALRRGWFSRPLESVMPYSSPTEYEPLTRSLTWEQVPLLLAELAPARAATCAFLVGLGADWVAVERARVEDFEPSSVLVRGTKNSRRWARVPVVPPFADLVEQARAWLAAHGAFPSWDNAVRDMAAACARAGLPRVTPRDLRRTHGRVLRARGVPPALIGGMLRHADGRMAERAYAQLGTEDLGRLVGAITAAKPKRGKRSA